MKKQSTDTLELAVDRGPRQAETRRKARDSFLSELGLTSTDDQAMSQEIRKRIERAKSMRRIGEMTVSDKYQFLSEVMAVFLLASEPKDRQLKLQRICIDEGVVPRSNTRLLHLLVRALSSYSPRERRQAHRDSLVIEYTISQGEIPSTLCRYLSTPGQGLDATYRRAVEFFGRGGQKAVKRAITIEPKAQQRSQSVQVGAHYWGYFIQSDTGPVLRNCITDAATVMAMLDFIKHRAPSAVLKEAHPVVGNRASLQSQTSGFRSRLPPSPWRRAKSPPQIRGS
jgi:hypothetical protein